MGRTNDVKGLKQIVENNGLLFQQGDSIDLALKIKKLYDDPETYEKVAQKCFDRAKNYDINKMVEQYIQRYKEVLNEA